MDEPDIALLRRAAAGDRDAFGEIFERYQQVVYRFARAMTGSTETADDVTQEVFVIFMRDLGRYTPERSALSTYLYGVVRNVSRGRRDSVAGLMTRSDPYERLLHAETGDEVRRGSSA